MAKKFGKFLLFTAVAGSAAAAACYYMQKKNASQKASEDEDYDNFTKDDTTSKNDHTYVPLTPDTKNTEEKEPDSGEQDSCFTPLSQQLSQAAESAEESVEEFFNEDTEDMAAPEKAE